MEKKSHKPTVRAGSLVSWSYEKKVTDIGIVVHVFQISDVHTSIDIMWMFYSDLSSEDLDEKGFIESDVKVEVF